MKNTNSAIAIRIDVVIVVSLAFAAIAAVTSGFLWTLQPLLSVLNLATCAAFSLLACFAITSKEGDAE